MAPTPNTDFDIFNDDFEVGEDSLPQENASSLGLPVPQFLSEAEWLPGEDYTEPEEPALSSADQDLFSEVGLTEYTQPQPRLVPQHRSPNLWPPTLVIDLAMGLEHNDDILAKHGMTERDLDRLMEVPSFRRELSAQIREQHENGLTFVKKAATQAETYLLTLDEMVNDVQVPASTRLAAIQSIVKWGGLEPKESGQATISGNTINLQINYTN